MAVIRRLVTTVSSSFDWVISQLENHEALVASAIRELQAAGKKARSQLARVRQDGAKIRARLTELRDSLELWEDRAMKVASEDKNKALECLKRRNQVAKEIVTLEVQEREHSKIESQLTAELQQMETRIDQLKRKKNEFAARETRTEVLKSQVSDNVGIIGELDEIFERWEDKISQCEPIEFAKDDLEHGFLEDEEKERLHIELEALLNTSR